MTDSRMTTIPFSRVSPLISVVGPLAAMAASLGATLPARGGDVVLTKRAITESACHPSIPACGARRFVSVSAADLDGDEDIDVVSVLQHERNTADDDEIAWYESDGGSPPTFTERVISTNANSASAIFAADLDKDGDTDVLEASADVAWYESDGGSPPNFAKRIISSGIASSVYAIDVDGDGDIDVLSANRYGDTIAWHENDGGSPPSFTQRVISTVADWATSVFAADLDADGDTDVLSASAADDKIAWYQNDGGLPPTFDELVISVDADAAQSVYAIDLDSDGDIDVLSASQDDGKIAWYESDGGSPPAFTERVISAEAEGAWSVSAADLDGDGDTDVLSATRFNPTVAWYESDGGSPPGFTEHVVEAISLGIFGSLVVLATDLNSDGRNDILSASGGSHFDAVSWYWNTDCTLGGVAVTAPSSVSQADQSKNRYLSIVPGNAGHPTAIRVTLVSSSTYPGDVGKQWWVGEPQAVCENSGQVALPAGGCGPAPGIPNNAFWQSELVCNQECHDWHSVARAHIGPLEALHISGPGIVPGSVYELEVINCQCDPSNPIHYSTAVPFSTSQWSDTVGVSLQDCPASGPNGGPIDLILDCVSIVRKFSNLPCAPLKSRMDLHPGNPNLIIDIADIVACIGGFTGEPYPYPAPVGCP